MLCRLDRSWGGGTRIGQGCAGCWAGSGCVEGLGVVVGVVAAEVVAGIGTVGVSDGAVVVAAVGSRYQRGRNYKTEVRI